MTKDIYKLIKKDISKNDRILQIGVTFKENVTDIRNSKAVELAKFLIKDGHDIELYDPVAQEQEVSETYGLKLVNPSGYYDYVLLAVAHEELVKDFNKKIFKFLKNNSVLFDIKGALKNRSFKKNVIYKSL